MPETFIQKTWRIMAENSARDRARAARQKPEAEIAQDDPNAPLTPAAAKALTKQIREHLDGAATLILRAHKLEAWSVLGYASWLDYARKEFDISKSHAYRLLDHAETVEDLTDKKSPPMGDLPESERQTRPMKGLPPSAKKKAWKKAVKSAGGKQPTATQVAAAVEDMKPAKAREVASEPNLPMHIPINDSAEKAEQITDPVEIATRHRDAQEFMEGDSYDQGRKAGMNEIIDIITNARKTTT